MFNQVKNEQCFIFPGIFIYLNTFFVNLCYKYNRSTLKKIPKKKIILFKFKVI